MQRIATITRKQAHDTMRTQLYTNNFLLMNAWEAWKATRNPKYGELYRSLADYMCRIQIESPDKRFDGGWMRAFDLNRGEY